MFQREIRRARGSAGLTQAVGARLVGISASEWSRIENGHIAPRDWLLAGRMAAGSSCEPGPARPDMHPVHQTTGIRTRQPPQGGIPGLLAVERCGRCTR